MAGASRLVEATWLLLPHETGVVSSAGTEVVRSALEGVDCLLIGPGMGTEETTGDFLSRLFGISREGASSRIGFLRSKEDASAESARIRSLVVDADGLKLLSAFPVWWKALPPGSILTPHPGEMAIMLNEDIGSIQADRIGTARRAAEQWGHTVVLKGAYTVVASPGRTAVIPFATRGLAHAGTGDVLAGVLAALRAQGVPAHEAAVAGAYLHGLAGAKVRKGEEESLLASEVADGLSAAMVAVRRHGADRTPDT
jgi:NAD(P)H-hydrate epimerase